MLIESNSVYPPSASPPSLSSSASAEYLATQPALPATIECAIGFRHKVKVSVWTAVSDVFICQLLAVWCDRAYQWFSLGLTNSGHNEENRRNQNVYRPSWAEQSNHSGQPPSSPHWIIVLRSGRCYCIFNRWCKDCILPSNATSWQLGFDDFCHMWNN